MAAVKCPSGKCFPGIHTDVLWPVTPRKRWLPYANKIPFFAYLGRVPYSHFDWGHFEAGETEAWSERAFGLEGCDGVLLNVVFQPDSIIQDDQCYSVHRCVRCLKFKALLSLTNCRMASLPSKAWQRSRAGSRTVEQWNRGRWARRTQRKSPKHERWCQQTVTGD